MQRLLTLLLFTALPLLVAPAAPSAQTLIDEVEQARLDSVSELEEMVMVPMRDGVRLATDVYLPKGDGPFPVVFVKTPYDFNELRWPVRQWALEAVERGYAFVQQNERGRYYSEGEWEILGLPRSDGYDSLSWLAEQDWSTGKVATLGCSSTAEWQMALAAMDHPAHAAMVPMAAGAGIGRVGEFQEQGNWFKGGVHQILFTTWLYSVQQNLRPRFPEGLPRDVLQRLRRIYDLTAEMPEVDWNEHLLTLPAVDWLKTAGGNRGPGADFLTRTPADPAWFEGGLYHDDEDFGVPAYWFNSWFDVSQGPNLALFEHVRNNASDPAVRAGQYALVAPTLHCGFYRTPEYEDLVVGKMNMGDARYPYWEKIFAFLDHYLKGEDNGFREATAPITFYTMGRNEWASADQWPPADVVMTPFHLESGGNANSLYGDGVLQREAPGGDQALSDTFTYDPMNPVPTLGGGFCCIDGAADPGSFDQRAIEARADVLVYTSEPLAAPLEVTGPVRARLFVSSTAKDTDFTVKLVDVHPDGSAWNIDDTIFRARYREGFEEPVFMEPGEVYELALSPMSTSYEFAAGHRVRVEISSSKFPQYNRNLNTGGDNVTETEAVVARNTIHHSEAYPSRITLPLRSPLRPAPVAN